MLHAWIDPAACRDVAPATAVRCALDDGAAAVVFRARTVPVDTQLRLADELDRISLPAAVYWAGEAELLTGLPAWCAGLHLAAHAIERIAALGSRGYARIGCSVHDADELQRARGASFVTVSPVFAPRSKPLAGPALGLDGLTALVRGASVPVVALGGVTAASVADIAATGAAGVAALTPFCRADRTEARALLRLVATTHWDRRAP